jgi:hypothetical protein
MIKGIFEISQLWKALGKNMAKRRFEGLLLKWMSRDQPSCFCWPLRLRQTFIG